ncbi:MAG: methylmalonyl-CoA mutase family protein [Chloroflexi bacterium]|nr:methylmalonyl-CoA mutase family protein [Chloroflexota bacterium]
MGDSKGQPISASGIPIREIYTPEDLKDFDYDRDLGLPGQPPFTRGVYPTMYRGQLWTIRRLSGFNTPEETNKLYREEYALGQTGFSIAPDISTAVGMDADDPRVAADIGHAGVPLSSLEDVETTFEGLPIEKASTYIADRCGNFLTAMYFVMAERRGLDVGQLRGTTVNDMLSWSVPSLVNQVSPEAYVRYAVDFMEWCCEHAPNWNTVSFGSYNARDMGLNAVQELGMLMATAIQYVDEARRRGRVPLDRLTKRISFDTGIHNDFFEEIAKLRAARRMWHKIITERYGITDPRCALFRVHCQSSGSTHTTQEPFNNIIRIAYQVLAGALGGAQSIHANGYDEGICLPTDQSMLLSIRTEQIAGLETNVTNTIDPLGGSYYVESLTNELQRRGADSCWREQVPPGEATVHGAHIQMGSERPPAPDRQAKEVQEGARCRQGCRSAQEIGAGNAQQWECLRCGDGGGSGEGHPRGNGRGSDESLWRMAFPCGSLERNEGICFPSRGADITNVKQKGR